MSNDPHTALRVFNTFCGVLTLMSSSSVVLTGILFPIMMTKLFMKIIFFISLSDVVGSIFLLFGYPSTHSVLCSMQGFFILFSFRCSIFWTVALTAELYGLVIYDCIVFYESHLHIIIWTISLLLGLLPLIPPDSYGQGKQILILI